MEIDLTPKGMKTDEGVKRVHAAIVKRNDHDSKCYLHFADLIDTIGYDGLLKALRLAGLEEYEAKELCKDTERLIRKRKDMDEEFLCAVAGQQNKSADVEYCDECGAGIPEQADSVINKYHKDTCSAYLRK